jgi:hypothetical protein
LKNDLTGYQQYTIIPELAIIHFKESAFFFTKIAPIRTHTFGKFIRFVSPDIDLYLIEKQSKLLQNWEKDPHNVGVFSN